jgi:hypothetical protein
MTTRDANLPDPLEALEGVDPPDQWVLLCLLAGRDVTLDEQECRAALRRSELLLAAGGDPRRPLELWGRAVTALAEDLDSVSAREQLATGLRELNPAAVEMPSVADALRHLEQEGDLAWQCFAMALLADELGSEE